jgi:nucleoside 2-deoxyribosyltransferase
MKSTSSMKTIYLCGPIADRTDEECKNWREAVKRMWSGACLDPMDRDYRGRYGDPGVDGEIVMQDKRDIQVADGLIVYYALPSVGTAMEIYYAWLLRKPIVLVNASMKPVLSPWLTHHVPEVRADLTTGLERLFELIPNPPPIRHHSV